MASEEASIRRSLPASISMPLATSRHISLERRWHGDQEEITMSPGGSNTLCHGSSEPVPTNENSGEPSRRSDPITTVEEPNLDNPFALFETIEELDKGVECLATQHGLLKDVDGLKRAARFERDDMEAFGDPDFPESEIRAFQDEEKATFWQQTRSLRAAVLIIGGLSGVCQGWTQSVLNGTNIPLEVAFDLKVHPEEKRISNQFIYGALSASVALSSGVVGLFISDPIQNHWLGRRGAVALSAVVGMGATIGATCSRTIPQIIGCRVLIGGSLGAKASIIAPFLAELAPVNMRGAVLSTWQIADALGIFLGDIAWRVLETFNVSPDTRWRFLSATTLIPAIPLAIASYMIPESWMFLMKTNEYPKATEAACLYRKHPIQGYRDIISSHFQMEAEGELMEIRKAVKEEKTRSRHNDEERSPAGSAVIDEVRPLSERLSDRIPGLCQTPPGEDNKCQEPGTCPHSYHMKEVHFFRRLGQIIKDSRCRHALISSSTVMLTQSLCGINAFAFFSSSLLNAGLTSVDSLTLALCFGGVSFGFGLLTPFLSDRLGRTTLVLIGLPAMAIFMFILASLFELENSARTPAIVVFTMLFTAVYSFTLGPAAFSLSAESFPSTVREAGMAICVFINMTSLGIQLLIYPFITAPIGFTASLCIYGCVDILGFIACFLFCVDTKDRTLEQLQFSFDLPLSVHCEYRLFYVLPEVTRNCVSFLTSWTRGKKGQGGMLDSTSLDSSTESEWGLIPFYRWARIQDPYRPSVYQQLLDVCRKAVPIRQSRKAERRKGGASTPSNSNSRIPGL
ncbi:hypothetical protein LOZ65_005301 [Ophidiomyces ophidiicola]|nr:hypothetical protein LOZ65_005301 [Ophidiomyces ophidiicola]